MSEPVDGTSPRGQAVIACAVVTVVVAGVAVILRFITRGRIFNCLGRDDWCIAAALVFSIANTTGMVLQAKYALGQHIATVSPESLKQFLMGAFWTILAYNISLTLTKISIIFLYLRIFDVPTMRKSCYATLVLVTVYGIWLFFSEVFFCIPVQSFWDVTIKGRCLPKAPVWFTNAGINILTDFVILLLPVPVIGSLQLTKRQRIGLYCVFLLGLLVCVVSVLRLRSLYDASISPDPTWDNIGVAIWSCIELNTAILCACLTTLKPLISKCFPRLFSTARASNTRYFQHSKGIDTNESRANPFSGKSHRAMTTKGSVHETIRGRVELSDLESQEGSVRNKVADSDRLL